MLDVNAQELLVEPKQNETPEEKSSDDDFYNMLVEPEKDAKTPTEKVGDASADGGDTDKKSAKPRTIAEAAERMGLKVEELYDLEFALPGDGKTVKLGELKDHYAARTNFDVEKLKFEEDKVQIEQGHLRAKEEFSTILGKLKEVIPAGHFDTLIQAGRAEHTKALNAQKAKLFELIPEWQDKDLLQREFAEMDTHLEPYFGKGAMKAFNNATLVKYIRDSMKREQRVKAALAKMTEVVPSKVKSASKTRPEKVVSINRKTTDPRRDFAATLLKS